MNYTAKLSPETVTSTFPGCLKTFSLPVPRPTKQDLNLYTERYCYE